MINYPTGDKNASTIYRSLELIGTVGAVFRELDAEFIEEVSSKSFGQSLTNTVEVGGLNKMTAVLGYLIGLLIYSPFNLIIHELGHAFFIKLLGGKINKIHIGVGGPLINLKGFSFNKYFFILGYVDFDYSTVIIAFNLYHLCSSFYQCLRRSLPYFAEPITISSPLFR